MTSSRQLRERMPAASGPGWRQRVQVVHVDFLRSRGGDDYPPDDLSCAGMQVSNSTMGPPPAEGLLYELQDRTTGYGMLRAMTASGQFCGASYDHAGARVSGLEFVAHCNEVTVEELLTWPRLLISGDGTELDVVELPDKVDLYVRYWPRDRKCITIPLSYTRFFTLPEDVL